MKKALLVGGMAALATIGSAQAALVVNPTADANVLASTILGSGITLVGTPSYTGGAQAAGTFTGGLSAGIGIDKGIILTSGDASLAPGPNANDGAGAALGLPGDSDLNGLIPQSTNDAAVLEFEFTTTGGDLFFNFVFASEEYNEFVNSGYNDVFAFFVDGTNIALIPGTGTPVAINNVNCGNPYTPGGGTHCDLFNNNDLSDGGPFYGIEYDGFTDVLTAQALGLGAGQHHFKLAIADAGDSILDSAVFIQGSTFSDTPTPPGGEVPEPGILSLLAAGIGSLIGLRRRQKA